MVAQPQLQMSEWEYLRTEPDSPVRREYYAGQVFAMAGASRRHNVVNSNVLIHLGNQLRNRPCEVYANDMRVRTASGLYVYPDIIVLCGEPLLADNLQPDTLLNPTVIVEVLSSTTETYDRSEKFDHYRTVESLQHYILAAQDKARIEVYTRQTNGIWALTGVCRDDGAVELAALDCQLELAEVYRKVNFDEA